MCVCVCVWGGEGEEEGKGWLYLSLQDGWGEVTYPTDLVLKYKKTAKIVPITLLKTLAGRRARRKGEIGVT